MPAKWNFRLGCLTETCWIQRSGSLDRPKTGLLAGGDNPCERCRVIVYCPEPPLARSSCHSCTDAYCDASDDFLQDLARMPIGVGQIRAIRVEVGPAG